ncbi:unnamed protein product, partial [Rotaria sp. Silwood2]
VLILALHTHLIVILYKRDYLNINKCNKESCLVHEENLFTYAVLSMLQVAYIGFDILNHQASIHALPENCEYLARAAEHLALLEDFNHVNVIHHRHISPTESFETVNEDFVS